MKKEDKEIISITRFFDFDEIPNKPERSEFWMLDITVALWFTTHDNRWRFLFLEMHEPARRSGESFDTKQEAKEFYQTKKTPTWVKGAIDEK